MLAALAVDDGLSSSRWLAAKPCVSPLAVVTAPVGFRAIELDCSCHQRLTDAIGGQVEAVGNALLAQASAAQYANAAVVRGG